MQKFRISSGALAVGLGLVGAVGFAQKDTAPPVAEPVLIELFTSQGCSSCPPADQLASKLVKDAGLIVVTRPVTYWDRLGWKDTLALEANTDLQRAYARTGLAGNNGVYTPQMVVDGAVGVIGSRERMVRRLARRATMRDQAAIRAKNGAEGTVIVGLGGTTTNKAELYLLAIDDAESVSIGRGENGGRVVRYTNVLRAETKLGEWNGGKKALTIAASKFKTPEANRYALVLREPNGGKVLAAQMVPGKS